MWNLISTTDGAGVQTFFLYDDLGSTTDLTDDSGNVIAGCMLLEVGMVLCAVT